MRRYILSSLNENFCYLTRFRRIYVFSTVSRQKVSASVSRGTYFPPETVPTASPSPSVLLLRRKSHFKTIETSYQSTLVCIMKTKKKCKKFNRTNKLAWILTFSKFIYLLIRRPYINIISIYAVIVHLIDWIENFNSISSLNVHWHVFCTLSFIELAKHCIASVFASEIVSKQYYIIAKVELCPDLYLICRG